MTTPLSPGVYVVETPGGPRAIEGAPTAVTIFIGEAERGPITPTRVNSRIDFERIYGGYFRHRPSPAADTKLFLPYAVAGFFNNGGPSCYVLRAMDGWSTDPTVIPTLFARRQEAGAGVGDPDILEAAWPGIWGDSISLAVNTALDGDPNRFRIVVFYQAPNETAAELVEKWEGLSADPDDESYVADALRRSSYIRWVEGTPVAIPPSDGAASQSDADMEAAAVALTGGVGGGGDLVVADYAAVLDQLREIDDAALLVNGTDKMLAQNSAGTAEYINMHEAFIAYVQNRRPKLDLFFVGDLPRFNLELDPVTTVAGHARGTIAPGSTATNFNALYWPHIVVGDPVGEGGDPSIVLPPAGHIAGLYGRTDARRGVWKAPAGVNLAVGGVRALDFNLLDVHQDVLNPLGVNALRQIPNAGLVIWGARTRQPSSQWRYIPVRRTAMFLRKSIYNGIQWAVFEPNDQRLWSSLRATIGAFMETQFRNGAFAGATSQDAYFVKCDAETTTEADQTAGVVNVLVGFAPLRSAEFVIVKLSQKAGQTA
jgi:phage tail sheath protein FI